MRIQDAVIQDNRRLEVISNGGIPSVIPLRWRPVLSSSDVLIAIPDMHMFVHQSCLDNFKYGAEPMLDFLYYLEDIQQQLARVGKRLRVVQLGDLYELRFPSPTTGCNTTSREIRRSHPRYEEIIRQLYALDPLMIYGNHDYEHRRLASFHDSARDGAVYLEHGFTADRWYHFSNPHKPFWHIGMSVFHTFRRAESAMHRAGINLGLMKPELHRATGITSGEIEQSEYPRPCTYPVRPLQYYARLLTQTAPHARHTRICIAAHTHQPFLRTGFGDGERMYIDAGAWTDGRTDFAVVTNTEVAICRYSRDVWANRRTSRYHRAG